MRISPRLQVVYDNLLEGYDVWDVCCDHGFLGGAAYESRRFANIYFVDQVSTIVEKVKTIFETYVFKSENPSLAFFLTESGENLKQEVTGNLCITGVGAHVIYDILCGLAKNNKLNVHRMILGPHRDEEKLEKMLAATKLLNQYCLTSKKEITENGRNRIFFILDRI